MATRKAGEIFAGQYRFIELLTAMGTVERWRAVDTLAHDEPVVLALHTSATPLSADAISAFRSRCAAAIAFTHPHLHVPRHFNVEDGQPYCVYAALPWQTLRDRLRMGTRSTELEVIHLLRDIGGALAYLGQQGVSDCTTAHVAESVLCDDDRHFALTGLWWCDESAATPPDAAVDSYDLAALAVEMLTGTPPTPGQPPLLRNVSDGLRDLLLRCLDADPTLRPSPAEIERWVRWQEKGGVVPSPAMQDAEVEWKRLQGGQRRRRTVTFAAVLLVLVGGAFLYLQQMTRHTQQQVQAARQPSPMLPHVVLRLHGSNTIGSELTPRLIEQYLRKKGATKIVRVPGDADEMTVRCEMPDREGTQAVEVFAHGSSTSFEDMASGTCDIGMASRRIKDEEVEQLSPMGTMTSPACEHVLALDGVVVIVHPNNRVSRLTIAQLNQIFSGAVTNWKAVGGADAPITVYARDDKSGTYDTFKSLVLKKDQALVASAERFESSEALRKMVAADTHGIGFVGLTFVQQVTALAISSGAAYVSPTAFSIATEEYPLARRLYYYTPATPENELTRDFIEFALSQEGQQLVNETGFVGQNLQVASSRKSAQRLNVSFRFTSGSANLDNKAQRDLERLARMMQQPENARRALLLYGYCDNQGNPQANQFLSQQRAQAVARLLKQRGLTPAYVKGYGAANPIASNATSEGRERNRRVDVWLK